MSGIVEWRELKLVTQDTDVSCGLAALAMIRGLTMEAVKDELKLDGCGPVEWRRSLQQVGYTLSLHENIDWENLWLLIVPSPNKHGATHVCVLDARPCTEGEPAVFLDPQLGNHRRFHWTFDDYITGRCVIACAYRVDPFVPPLER